jgi:aspartate carbamoyltransferase regulatory subunit
MNKTQTKKLAALVAKSSNQQDAVLAYMSEGNSITSEGARTAGIGDPRRTVNRLRNSGVRISRDVQVSRNGSAIVYCLAPASKSRRASKR